LRSLFRRGLVDRDLDDELRHHVDLLIEGYIEAGLSPDDARHRAAREMGALTSPIEACRDARGLTWFDDAVKDVRYAGRSLRGSAALTATIVAVLALGIGASTTIFAFANAVLLRPLPYPSPGRIVVLHERALDAPAPLNVHPQNFVEWRSRSGVFESLVLVQTPPLNVMGTEGSCASA
jgi:hypothetical protein